MRDICDFSRTKKGSEVSPSKDDTHTSRRYPLLIRLCSALAVGAQNRVLRPDMSPSGLSSSIPLASLSDDTKPTFLSRTACSHLTRMHISSKADASVGVLIWDLVIQMSPQGAWDGRENARIPF